MTSPDTRKTGTIARLFLERIYGFIFCPEDGRDYFFHQAQLEDCTFRDLVIGQAVTFTVGTGPKGIQAQAVRLEGQTHQPVTPTARRQPRGRR